MTFSGDFLVHQTTICQFIIPYLTTVTAPMLAAIFALTDALTAVFIAALKAAILIATRGVAAKGPVIVAARLADNLIEVWK